jgi:hypothetical protein
LIVRSAAAPTGTGKIAALEVVARPKAKVAPKAIKAAPKAIVRIIDRILIFRFFGLSPLAPIPNEPARRDTIIEDDKDNDGQGSTPLMLPDVQEHDQLATNARHLRDDQARTAI